jgi:hypothetical protein
MAKLSLQFHARRDEVAQLVAPWVTELGLWLAYETLTPAYSNVLVAQGRLSGDLEIPFSANRLVLSVYPIQMDAEAPFGLIKGNLTALSILLGKESISTLGESVLQAMTDDPKSLSEWKKIRKAMMLSFRRGAHVVNSASGARDNAGDHYFSPGAKELFVGGARMVGLTEVLSYEFD